VTIKATCIFLAVLMFTLPVLVSALETEKIIAQAKKDAENDVNGMGWMVVGCFFAYLGVGAAYLFVRNPPPSKLMGKPADYVFIYAHAYRRAVRSKQVTNALAGCLGILALGLGILLIINVGD